MKNKISFRSLAIFSALFFYLCPAHAGPSSLMPAHWEYSHQEPAHLWRKPDHSANAILVDVRRNSRVESSAKNLESEKSIILRERERLFDMLGFTNIRIDHVSVRRFGLDSAVMEIRMRYRTPGGVWMQAFERLYSAPEKTRLTAITFPLDQEQIEKPNLLLERLAPKWNSRSVANAHSEGDIETEAQVCCGQEKSTTAELAQPMPPVIKAKADKCKGVNPKDLKRKDEPGITLDYLYQESTFATPVGCGQGIYEATEHLVSGAWSVLKGAWNFTWDSKYRAEVAAAVGYGASAIWNDPIGVSKKLVKAVVTELVKNWEQIPCLNRRAGTKMICKALTGIIGGGYALQIVTKGLKAAKEEVPHLAQLLKDTLKNDDVIKIQIGTKGTKSRETVTVSSEPPSAGTAPTVVRADLTHSTVTIDSIKATNPKLLPFKSSLKENVERASFIGEFNEDLVRSRLPLLSSSATREAAYDELRRLDFVLSAILKEDGPTLLQKIDNYLKKHVEPGKEREFMRSCLVKPR